MSNTRNEEWVAKYRDPRWQRKRLEVMQRENFKCQECGDTGSTLNVHHGYYEKGLEPWDYDNETLHCLCESCHELFEAACLKARRSIGRIRCLDELKAIPFAVTLHWSLVGMLGHKFLSMIRDVLAAELPEAVEALMKRGSPTEAGVSTD